MLIDWFTVAAQAVNFLVLVWLLKRFLYKPVLRAIDAREAHIADAVRRAEEERAAAGEELESYRTKNAALDFDRAGLMDQAREEAKEAGKRLLEEERKAADAAREQWRHALADEQRRFGDELALRVRAETAGILRRALADLADETLEARMIAVFARRLRERRDVPAEMAGADLAVRSAFELTEDQKAELRRAIAEALPGAGTAGFRVDPALAGGVELLGGGRKIAWSLADYMGRLQENIAGENR